MAVPCGRRTRARQLKGRTAARERSRASARRCGSPVCRIRQRQGCGRSRNRTRPRPVVTVGEKSKRSAEVGVGLPGVARVATEHGTSPRAGRLWQRFRRRESIRVLPSINGQQRSLCARVFRRIFRAVRELCARGRESVLYARRVYLGSEVFVVRGIYALHYALQRRAPRLHKGAGLRA